MKVIRKFDQFRRDCKCEMECESCGNKQIYESAYDDRNFWDNVVPGFDCDKCKKSPNDLGLKPEFVNTRYDSSEVV